MASRQPGWQRSDPRSLEGTRSRTGADDVYGRSPDGVLCHVSMVGGRSDQAVRSVCAGQRSQEMIVIAQKRSLGHNLNLDTKRRAAWPRM